MRQERFSSTAAQRRGILANLVSHRVQTLSSAEDRELVWWLQELSQRDLNGPHYACSSFPSWPPSFQMPAADYALERLAVKLCSEAQQPVRTKRAGKPAKPAHVADFLRRLCLDPDCEFQHFEGFHELRVALHACKAQMESSHTSAVANTTINAIVREALDFCLSQRGIVLVEGTYRSGKTFSAQSWCLERPGRARYVSLSAYTDETTFFRLIARSLGSASGLQRKAQEVRQRVEESLRNRDLMLVIDECEHLLPAVARPTVAPTRLNYLMADLDNRGVAVTLIGGRNFSRSLTNLERKLPNYGAEQFFGRLRLRQQLPDALTEDDLFAVAALVLPEANEPTRMLLVGHALTAKGRIAALEHTAKRARFFAELECRQVAFGDVERAVAEAGTPPRTSRAASAKPAPTIVRAARPALSISAPRRFTPTSGVRARGGMTAAD